MTEISPAEAAARAFYNAHGGSYEMPEQSPPAAAAPAPAPAEAASAATEQPAPVDPVANAADAVSGLYSDPMTRGLVEWSEPPAQAAEYELQADPGVIDTSPEGQAAMGRLRDALAAAGAGKTLAAEVFGDAVRAATDPRWRVGRETAERELRATWGDQYDAQVALAAGLVQRAARHSPEIVPFLERTGLGNSPEFIQKLAAAARRRAR